MRSYLFVPGDSPRKMEKALTAGADVLLIDLEDSVSLAQKEAARKITGTFLKQHIPTTDRPSLYVRVNALDTDLTDDDLAMIVPCQPDGIMLPKSQSGKSITALDVKLKAAEAVAGVPLDRIKIIPVATETATAIFNLGTYGGSSPRLSAMTWGAEDLSADIGAESNRDEAGAFTSPFRLVRDLCLIGAAAAQVDPVDGVYINFRDSDGLRQECIEARRDGFVGKMAIHPAQVPIINEVFTPDDTAIEKARRIVESFSQAGDVGVVGIDGEMIDRPHLRRAETTLRRAGLMK
ncbi:CoA ester lyase [Cohaesibacter sp. CAU 1516]|uniref:HpcH/HpaI aldolase/citrate lyase family protein n=1 Tax=Cohaesibacter sp. CAU 1516 TaxID=2576038 RepID=UPI0010FD5BC5|nr:CoA ester lyase [Cohaesibacter sp. CAU 1516]TLP48655.1 CoA ester lyase [Cohaesibacter sp. CAU 1516]